MNFSISANTGQDKSRPRSNANRRRFAGSEHKLPSEISDPHTIRDESKPTWRELLARYRWFALISGTAMLFLGVFLFAYMRHMAPEIAGNRYVQATVAIVVLAGGSYAFGRKTQREQVVGYDWLVLVKPNGVTRYLGYYVPAEDRDFPLFVPVKGFSMMGHRAETYKVGEISADLAQSWSNMNRDPDAPAAIRLHQEFCELEHTEHGSIVAQLSGGLKVDPFGRMSSLQATVPQLADAGRLDDIRVRLEDTLDELENERARANAMERQRDNILDEATKPMDEQFDQFVDRFQRIEQSRYSRRRRSESEDVDGLGPSMNTEQVERELGIEK